MAFRFRKSIKIFSWLKINFSKHGVGSVTVGKPGASINVSEEGVRASVGIPGTGVTYNEKIVDVDNATK